MSIPVSRDVHNAMMQMVSKAGSVLAQANPEASSGSGLGPLSQVQLPATRSARVASRHLAKVCSTLADALLAVGILPFAHFCTVRRPHAISRTIAAPHLRPHSGLPQPGDDLACHCRRCWSFRRHCRPRFAPPATPQPLRRRRTFWTPRLPAPGPPSHLSSDSYFYKTDMSDTVGANNMSTDRFYL